MTTTASLPTTRPTSDTYGPDLTNDGHVVDRERELDADNWNKAKADIAAACEVAPLAIIRIANDGVTATVAAQRPAALGTVTATRAGSGYVDVTFPGGVTPLDAIVTVRGAATLATSTQITGQVVRCWTSADADFTLLVY